MPETPTFEVKKVKNFMGSDMPGYNLDLWMDGKLIAYVVNDGGGGDTQFTYVENGKEVFHSETQRRFEEYCRALPPLPPSENYDKELPMDEGLFVEELLERYDAQKQLGRACAKHTVFKLPQDIKGAYRTLKNTPFNEASKALVLRKHPNAVFINEVFPTGNWYEILERAPI